MATSSSSLSLTDVLEKLSLSEKLLRLSILCPSDVEGIELIVDDCLERRWPKARTFLRMKLKS